MFSQLEPIETGDLEAEVVPEAIKNITRKRCSPAVKQFMHNALRELGPKNIDDSINVPVQSFERLGLDNKYKIVSTLEACPESEYIKVEAIDDQIKLTKVAQPETKPVKHYIPK